MDALRASGMSSMSPQMPPGVPPGIPKETSVLSSIDALIPPTVPEGEASRKGGEPLERMASRAIDIQVQELWLEINNIKTRIAEEKLHRAADRIKQFLGKVGLKKLVRGSWLQVAKERLLLSKKTLETRIEALQSEIEAKISIATRNKQLSEVARLSQDVQSEEAKLKSELAGVQSQVNESKAAMIAKRSKIERCVGRLDRIQEDQNRREHAISEYHHAISEYHYVSPDQFYRFAYPEHTFNDEVLDLTSFQDLYDARYSEESINHLLANLRQRVEAEQKPIGLTIVVSAHISPENCLLQLDSCIQNALQQAMVSSCGRVVILSSIQIGAHAHALVLHLTATDVHCIFTDPYGNHPYLREGQRQLSKFLVQLVDKYSQNLPIKFHYLETNFDLQGLYYDDNNCGALTLYCLEQYLECALWDKHPNDYRVDKIFDALPSQELNNSLHQAFVLRLKARQLVCVSHGNDSLRFQSDPSTYFQRDKHAKALAEQLIMRINDASQTTYQDFISIYAQIIINRLNREQKFVLFNCISDSIVYCKVSNSINPPKLTSLITRIVHRFQQPRDLEEVARVHRIFLCMLTEVSQQIIKECEELKEKERKLLHDPNTGASGIPDFSQPTQATQGLLAATSSSLSSVAATPSNPRDAALAIDRNVAESFALRDLQSTVAVGTNLKTVHLTQPTGFLTHQPNTFNRFTLTGVEGFQLERSNPLRSAVLSGDLNLFLKAIEVARIEPNFFLQITYVLNSLLNDLIQNPDQFRTYYRSITDTQVIYDSSLGQIFDQLLKEGADPFKCQLIDSPKVGHVSFNDSTLSIIARLPIEFTRVLLAYFPNSLEMLFVEASFYCNLDLINFICSERNLILSTRTLAEAKHLAGNGLPKKEACWQRNLPLFADHNLMRNLRTRESVIRETRSYIEIFEQGQKGKLPEECQTLGMLSNNHSTTLPRRSKNPHMALIDAVEAKDLPKVRELLESGQIKNIDMLNEAGVNALWVAFYESLDEISKYLLQRGASLTYFNFPRYENFDYCTTPIDLAIWDNKIDFLDAVLNNNTQLANVNFPRLLAFAQERNLTNSLAWLQRQNQLFQNNSDSHLLNHPCHYPQV
jgi:hypothetical protein